MSDYRISITRPDGKRVELHPGSHGERDLVDALVTKLAFLNADRLCADLAGHGVGVFRSEARVLAALRAIVGDAQAETRHAIEGVLRDLKGEVRPTR